MKHIAKKSLKIIFIIDAILAIGFGLYSWFFPYETFGTIILIPEMNEPMFLAILTSLSIFYILIGLTCLIGLIENFTTSLWIGLLMILRHVLEGGMKIIDIEEEQLIGNPNPDILIHLIFITFYILILITYYTYRDKETISE